MAALQGDEMGDQRQLSLGPRAFRVGPIYRRGEAQLARRVLRQLRQREQRARLSAVRAHAETLRIHRRKASAYDAYVTAPGPEIFVYRNDHKSDNPASVTLLSLTPLVWRKQTPVRDVRKRGGEPNAAAKHARGRSPPGPHAQTGVRKRNRTPPDCAPSRWVGRSWAGPGVRGPS